MYLQCECINSRVIIYMSIYLTFHILYGKERNKTDQVA